MQNQKAKIKCPNCNSINIIKKGRKKRRFREIQQFQCKNCKKFFLQEKQENKTYPLKIILSSISNYNLGYKLSQVSNLIKSRYKTKIPISTISSWLNQYKPVCIYSKLRKKAIKLYKPNSIIFKKPLQHQQVYLFKYHKAKLYLLFHDIKYNNQFTNTSKFYEPIKSYLNKIATKEFPHHIFKKHQSPEAEIEKNNLEIESTKNNAITALEPYTEAHTIECDVPSGSEAEIAQKNILNKNNIEQRASQLKFNHLKIETKNKNNFACKLAELALNLATTNKDRHQAIQNFFLINDSTTIATEVPVYLTNDDILYYKIRHFVLNFNNNSIAASGQSTTTLTSGNSTHTSTTTIQGSEAVIAKNSKIKQKIKTPITGHIDIVQIRNGLIHILDYKPEADKKEIQEQAIQQLTIYALALASKTKLDLHSFKCAWFDENNYFEFFPLHAVYKKK